MSVTYGFFNSLNGDRKYDALQLSSMFDGVILDGIFASIGECFLAKAADGLAVNIGTGKAWFDHTWILNDAVFKVDIPEADGLLDRIDAVVLDIDNTESVRANSIKIVQGAPATNPAAPEMISVRNHHQHPICYIRVAAAAKSIRQADITNKVGTTETPFVSGVLQTIDLDKLLGQWQDELDQFVENETSDFTDWTEAKAAEYEAWFAGLKADLVSEKEAMNTWISNEENAFTAWFNQMKGQLSEDAAGNLQLQVDKKTERKSYQISLAADIWSESSPYVQNVTLADILAGDMVFLQPDLADISDNAMKQAVIEAWGMVSFVTVTNGKLTFTALEECPEVAIPLDVGVIR